MDSLVNASLATLDQVKWFTESVGPVGVALDRITLTALERTPALPEALLPQLGWGSKPVPDPAADASWDVHLGYLYDSLARVRSHVAGLTDADLAKGLPSGMQA